MTVKRLVPNVPAADPSTGRSFYVDVLGLDLAMDIGLAVTFAAKDNPLVQVSLIKLDPYFPHPDYTVEVSDLEDCHARAITARCEIVYELTTEPWGVRRFFVRDPHGKIVNIMSHA